MKKPEIVILDAKPLINDGLNFDLLNEYGHVRVFDKTSPEQVLERAQQAEIIITNKVKLQEEHFLKMPNLRYIGETATGVDNIDISAAQNFGITVTNVPDYSTDSVAQHVIALLLAQTNSVEQHNLSIKNKDWDKQAYFSYWLQPVTELANMTLGLLGFGRVAQKVATIAKALGMKVIAYKPNKFESEFVDWVSLESLLTNSDVISLHCPLTGDTRQIINQKTLNLMKSGAVLINTGRGGLIDELALAEALINGKLQVACLDVLNHEPPEMNNPLLEIPNCIITPHIAWASLAARKRLINHVCENIIQFLRQQPINLVTKPKVS